MKKLLIVGLVGATAVSANAQTIGTSTGINAPSYSPYQRPIETYEDPSQFPDTPTVQAEKLARAKALTIEAETLLKQDGGKFTPKHDAYIRRKACAILDYGRIGRRHRC